MSRRNLTREVLVLGGYGNFGSRIARGLARSGIPVLVAGRNPAKASALAAEIRAEMPGASVRGIAADVDHDLHDLLRRVKPGVVIDTCGPFQARTYLAAEACIENGVHYIDLADGRDFVAGISALDGRAREAGVRVISGASTVPGLSSAVLDYYAPEFKTIVSFSFGITLGQKTARGLAAAKATLGWVGRCLRAAPGDSAPRYGWQGLHLQHYPRLGWRWMANCDVPDLDLLPSLHPIGRIRLSAGLESSAMHLGLWFLGWCVRAGLPLRLPERALFLLRACRWLDRFGTSRSGAHAVLRGTGDDGKPLRLRWFIIADGGDGSQIPCVPAIVLGRRLSWGGRESAGAFACAGLLSLEEYLDELKDFAVHTFVYRSR